MLFNSYEFVFLFFPLVLAAFFVVGRKSHTAAAGVLTIASLFFYAWWSVRALPLLLASIVTNYVLGRSIAARHANAPAHAKALLVTGLTLNLGLLAIFKYANFFVDNANAALHWADLPPLHFMRLALPIGISFYTFTQIAFLVDCWQGKVKEARFLHYGLFVTFFPHLIAGPILHHAQLMPQFEREQTYRPDASRIVFGLTLFALGLAKKVLLADPLGQYADMVFNIMPSGARIDGLGAWLGVMSYALQIYFDFSGYSDMAIGLSACLGIELPQNFHSPYKSRSMIEFWRRWHISLSTFLRDYLYIPLGGNRLGRARRYFNLGITMLLGGLWHGASWNFVLWGAIHGAALAINHAWRERPGYAERHGPAWTIACWLLTFVTVCFAWVLFRAASLHDAVAMFHALLGGNGFSGSAFRGLEVPYRQAEFYRTLGAGLLIATALPTASEIAQGLVASGTRYRLGAWSGAACGAAVAGLLAWGLVHVGHHNAFLYFQF